MARTTTALPMHDMVINLYDGATNRDVSGSTNSLTPNYTQTTGPFYTFDSRWPGRVDNTKDATFTLNIVFSTGTNEAWYILKNWFFATAPGARSLRFYHPDKNVGSDAFIQSVRINSLNWAPEAGAEGPIMVTAECSVDGDVTQSVAAT